MNRKVCKMIMSHFGTLFPDFAIIPPPPSNFSLCNDGTSISSYSPPLKGKSMTILQGVLYGKISLLLVWGAHEYATTKARLYWTWMLMVHNCSWWQIPQQESRTAQQVTHRITLHTNAGKCFSSCGCKEEKINK